MTILPDNKVTDVHTAPAPCEAASLYYRPGNLVHGAPCVRAAAWRVNLHGCRELVLCEDHLQSWKQSQCCAISQGRSLSCVHCGRKFERFDIACSIEALEW